MAFSFLSTPTNNDAGTVLFQATRPEGGIGIYNHSEGVVSELTYANAFGPAPFVRFWPESSGYAGYAKINNDGMVTFWARRKDGRQGIFIGPDPLADALLLEGDPLFGSTVSFVGFSNLNDRGDVAFTYRLSNGASGIAVAKLVPEPTNLCLTGVALVLAASMRRLRR